MNETPARRLVVPAQPRGLQARSEAAGWLGRIGSLERHSLRAKPAVEKPITDHYLIVGMASGVILTTVSPLFGAIPIGLLIAHCLLWLVPPARRALDVEADPHREARFNDSQKQLLRISKYLAPISLGVASIGALMSWRA
jgi:hypothetical protein